jgi:hypothetical protein
MMIHRSIHASIELSPKRSEANRNEKKGEIHPSEAEHSETQMKQSQQQQQQR